MNKLIQTSLALLFILSACGDDNGITPKDPADAFIGNYSVVEDMEQTFGGNETNHETFDAEIIKVSADTVQILDRRPSPPFYSLDENIFLVRNDSIISAGTSHNFKDFGSASFVCEWWYSARGFREIKWVLNRK